VRIHAADIEINTIDAGICAGEGTFHTFMEVKLCLKEKIMLIALM
jgi:hypothetical protein